MSRDLIWKVNRTVFYLNELTGCHSTVTSSKRHGSVYRNEIRQLSHYHADFPRQFDVGFGWISMTMFSPPRLICWTASLRVTKYLKEVPLTLKNWIIKWFRFHLKCAIEWYECLKEIWKTNLAIISPSCIPNFAPWPSGSI